MENIMSWQKHALVVGATLLAALWVTFSTVWSEPLMSPLIYLDGLYDVGKFPDAAYNPISNQYLVVWQASGGQGLRGRLVRSGETMGNVFQITDAFQSDGGPRVAFDINRSRYLVVWKRGNDGNRMYGRFIPWDGPSESLNEFVIDPVDEAVGEYAVTYSKAGDEFFVVWVTEHLSPSIYYSTVGRWIPADGSVPPGSTIPIASNPPNNRSWAGIAFNSVRNEYLITTHDYPKVNDNIYGVLVTDKGFVKPEFTIAGWPDDEAWPAVTACPAMDQYIVVWQSYHTSGEVPPYESSFYARYITGDGTPGDIRKIASFGPFYDFFAADVACGATDLLYEDPRYLAVYAGDLGLWGQLIFPNGTLGDNFKISNGNRPAVAGGNINHLVTWDNSSVIVARFIGNTKPNACFTVNPNEGNTNTGFVFNASCSKDATHPASDLQVRWDWNNDDIYEIPWSTNKTISHKFTLQPGQSKAVFYVKMQVTDGRGETDTMINTVTVHRHQGKFYIIKGKNGKMAVIYLE